MNAYPIDKRRLELHTLRRWAEWLEDFGERWNLNAAVVCGGPVVELELGYRVASELVHSWQVSVPR